MSTAYYPQSPAEIPKNLTALTSSYQLKAVLAILSVILFFVLYLVMVTALGFLVYYAFVYDMISINKITIILKAGAIAGSAMLFVFTLKFIFKLKSPKAENRIKLKKGEHPDLWAFIDQICKETGAPYPKNIYVDPDVNAYVAYSNMWLSLFLPVRKELTIGLGLVSCLNLSEFKAVVTHEFGHFAQRSMKIGSYIISANTVIHGMIFSRDSWDNALDQWRSSDIRLSAAAWVITPVIWLIRQILSLFYQFLNMMHSSLSREMEFNADKVAVSTSGSQAIVSALWRLDDGAENWNNTINHSYLAGQKEIFVKNMYQHNQLALDRTADKQKELFDKLPEDERGGRKFFSNSENSKVGMYTSHPPNDLRENSAKVPFVSCDEDNRSPWNLFGSPEGLQEEMSALVYEKYLSKKPTEYADSIDFEEFVSAETEGSDLQEEYLNTFKDRFLQIPTQTELTAVEETLNYSFEDERTKIKEALTELMKPVYEIEAFMKKAQEIAEGTTHEKSFSFHGMTYKKKDIHTGYNYLISQREKLFETTFKDWDTSFAALYMRKAKEGEEKKHLWDLYNQHKAITALYQYIVQVKNIIFKELEDIETREDVTQSEINTFGEKVNDLIVGINVEFDKLNDLTFIPMPNIADVDELKIAITENGKFKAEGGPIFENGGFDKLITGLDQAIAHCQRVDQKSIGLILTYHNKLHS